MSGQSLFLEAPLVRQADGELKNLPFGSIVVTFGLIVVTFGLIVVGFTNGELGKTAKKENISNFKLIHLSVLFK